MSSGPVTKNASAASSKSVSLDAPQEIDLRRLLGDATQLVIRHGDQRYILRLTRQNKLILTK